MTDPIPPTALLLLGYVSGLISRDGPPYFHIVEADAATGSAIIESHIGGRFRLSIEQVDTDELLTASCPDRQQPAADDAPPLPPGGGASLPAARIEG